MATHALKSELREKVRQNVCNKVHRAMADHIGDQIATPHVETGQDRAERQRYQNVGRASRPVAKRKNNQWNSGRPSGP